MLVEPIYLPSIPRWDGKWPTMQTQNERIVISGSVAPRVMYIRMELSVCHAKSWREEAALENRLMTRARATFTQRRPVVAQISETTARRSITGLKVRSGSCAFGKQ